MQQKPPVSSTTDRYSQLPFPVKYKYHNASLLVHLNAIDLLTSGSFFLITFIKWKKLCFSFSNLEKITEHQVSHRAGTGKTTNGT